MEKRYDVEHITPQAFDEIVKRSAGVYRYQRLVTTMAILLVVVVSAFSGAVYTKVNENRRIEREKQIAEGKLAILPDTEGILVRVPVAVPVTLDSPDADVTPVPAPEAPAAPQNRTVSPPTTYATAIMPRPAVRTRARVVSRPAVRVRPAPTTASTVLAVRNPGGGGGGGGGGGVSTAKGGKGKPPKAKEKSKK